MKWKKRWHVQRTGQSRFGPGSGEAHRELWKSLGVNPADVAGYEMNAVGPHRVSGRGILLNGTVVKFEAVFRL